MSKPYNDVPDISEFLDKCIIYIGSFLTNFTRGRVRQVTPPQSVFLEGSCLLKKHEETVPSLFVVETYLIFQLE